MNKKFLALTTMYLLAATSLAPKASTDSADDANDDRIFSVFQKYRYAADIKEAGLLVARESLDRKEKTVAHFDENNELTSFFSLEDLDTMVASGEWTREAAAKIEQEKTRLASIRVFTKITTEVGEYIDDNPKATDEDIRAKLKQAAKPLIRKANKILQRDLRRSAPLPSWELARKALGVGQHPTQKEIAKACAGIGYSEISLNRALDAKLWACELHTPIASPR